MGSAGLLSLLGSRMPGAPQAAGASAPASTTSTPSAAPAAPGWGASFLQVRAQLDDAQIAC